MSGATGAAAVTGAPDVDASVHDVAVVGAGVVGCAVARELVAHGLHVALLDAADDVGSGTSKANTAILHTGFDATPGTTEARLVARGYALLSEYAERAGIAVERTGALLVAWDEDQLAALAHLAGKARANGYDGTRLVRVDELRELEPSLGPGALGALAVPDESIVDPWTPSVAFATEVVRGGSDLLLRRRVTSVAARQSPTGEVHVLATAAAGPEGTDVPAGDVRARWLVNAAGLYADEVDAMLGHHDFTVLPRRGELVVFDKLARPLVQHVLLPVPTSRGKGVLVAPTVFGNVLLGPTADDVPDRRATASTAGGLASLRAAGRRILPALLDEEVTAVYAGLRAATEHADYRIRLHAEQRYLCVGGIRSTGLTAALAIAEHAVELMSGGGLRAGARRTVDPPRMPALGEASERPYQRPDLVARDPSYGTVVCHCERVTAGELRDALASAVPARSLEGLRRRTRATNGRCQGFHCGAAVRAVVQATAGGRP